jgi:CarboxypepD_reg-like domain/TonB-dependent Receptor Plug Domain
MRYSLFCLSIILPLFAHARSYTCFGYVLDQTTGEKLVGAGVQVPASGKGVNTNSQGYYSLTLPEGKHEVVVSYPGYTRLVVLLDFSKDTLLSFRLQANALLEEVEITASSAVNNDRPNVIALSPKQIRAIPALGGEVDVIKVIQRLPGIKSGNEGTTGLYVRGGTPDQNLILLDGVPIYNISHLFGFVSVFHASSISRVEVFKGDFPARYGGRLASVIDIHTKDGNLKSWHGEVEAGIISSKVFLEGPLKKDKSSIAVSARRSFYELYTLPRKWASNNGEYNNLFFNDLNFKLNYKISERDKIGLSAYFGRDILNLSSKYSEKEFSGASSRVLKWGNAIGSLRWNRLWGNRLFSNLSLYANDYIYRLTSKSTNIRNADQTLLRESIFNFNSKISDVGALLDVGYYPTPNHALKFGASLVSHVFTPGNNTLIRKGPGGLLPTDSTAQVSAIHALETRFYAEDNIKINRSFTLNTGLHASAFQVQGALYKSVEPRLLLSFRTRQNWGLSAGFTAMQQYLHLLTNSGLGIPADLWVPPTQKVAPQQAWQLSFGWNTRLSGGWNVNIDTYYKKSKNFIDYKPGSSFLIESAGWEQQVGLNGRGESKGIEFFVQKTTGKITGMAGYTLSRTDRTFPDINGGKTFPFRYDRRHDFQISGAARLNTKTTLNAAWTFYTGSPVTLPIAIYPSLAYPPVPNIFTEHGTPDIIDFDLALKGDATNLQRGTFLVFYGTKNNQRLPNYHRLDLSLQRTKKKKHGEQTWSFQIYNVYNRINPYYIRYRYKGGSPSKPLESKGEFEVVSLFQIIPSVSYVYKF